MPFYKHSDLPSHQPLVVTGIVGSVNKKKLKCGSSQLGRHENRRDARWKMESDLDLNVQVFCILSFGRSVPTIGSYAYVFINFPQGAYTE